MSIGRADWEARVEVTHTMTADAEAFLVSVLLDAYERDLRVFSKNWTFRAPRDMI